MTKVVHTSLLALGFLVACGGSASHNQHDPQPPSVTGGADGDSETGGTLAAGAVAPTGHGGGTSGTTASGGRNPAEVAGMDGLGGADAAPTLSLPPGCEPRARTETATACSLAVYCDTASTLTNCYRLDSGRWQCQCEPAHKDRTYQMENAPGLQACALAASLCAENELELGEETCEPTSESSAEGSCKIDLACGKPITLDAGTDARAWLMRFGSASCQPAESGTAFECGCSYGEMASQYDLLVDSGEPDCRPLVDFCMSGKTPNFDGPKQCLLTNTVSSSAGCDRSEACAVPMPLNSDVSLAQVEPRYANCTPRSGGGAECYCSDQDSSFNFQLPDAPDDALCESSILNCSDDAVIKATGAPSCQPTSITAFGDSCEADLSCLEDATVDDRKMVAEGRLTLDCARVEQGSPWWCTCASDQQTARFQLGAANVSAFQACSQAPAGCLQHLDVHVGPYGEFVQPPDPMPEP